MLEKNEMIFGVRAVIEAIQMKNQKTKVKKNKNQKLKKIQMTRLKKKEM